MTIDQYIAAHIDPEPAHLHRLYRQTHLQHLYPRMCSGHVQGRWLRMLAAMIRPARILELGTYTGYSTLSLAEGAPSGCQIDTIEIDDEMALELHERFTPYPNIHLHIGDALQIIPQLQPGWDMAFIDANKRHYTQYLNLIIDRLSPGAFIIADNTLWDGHILNPDTATDPQSRAIANFNDHVARHPRLSKVILPVRDGMTIIQVQK